MLWWPKMVPFGCFAPLNCVSFLLPIHPGWEPPLRYAWLCSTEARLCAGHEFFFEKTMGGTMGLLRKARTPAFLWVIGRAITGDKNMVAPGQIWAQMLQVCSLHFSCS